MPRPERNGNPQFDPNDVVIFTEDLGPLPPGVSPPPRIPFRPRPPLSKEEIEAYDRGLVQEIILVLNDDCPPPPPKPPEPPATPS